MNADETLCPACKAGNDADAAYCDQCGQHLEPRETADGGGEGGCPACGGVVEERGEGRGVCKSCGLELTATPDEEPAPPKFDKGTAARLTSAILAATGAGLPLEKAVAEACLKVLGAPPPAAAGAPAPCPLCGVENAAAAERCAGCGIWFGRPRKPVPCPRCERPVAGDGACECGAILTLPKLLEFIEPAVRFVCSRCRAPYAVARPECADCGGGLLSAERIKAFASDVGR